jgi:hypothetical protein
MRAKHLGWILVLAAAAVPASACAMSAPHQGPCRVLNGEKLPASSGGAEGICATVEHAIASNAPNVHYSAEIRVLSKSTLAARLVVQGRELPEQHFSVMDRDLNPTSIQRFAQTLGQLVAKAAKS